MLICPAIEYMGEITKIFLQCQTSVQCQSECVNICGILVQDCDLLLSILNEPSHEKTNNSGF